MEIGLVGKPNVGKSTFFEASTLAGVEIANYPFTTIQANKGMGYIRSADPGKELGVESQPKNSILVDDVRLVPVELLDVAGLVPDAHTGKGLGNQFLDDLRRAEVLIHVIDVSGSTDIEGNPVEKGQHDPADDIDFLVSEMDHWFNSILNKDWSKISRQSESLSIPVERLLAERLAGLGINIHHISDAMHRLSLGDRPTRWSEEELFHMAVELRKRSKPMIIAANKADRADDRIIDGLKEAASDLMVVPTCAEAEMALRRADKAGLISYVPGAGSFEIKDDSRLSPAQKKALDSIGGILERFGSTNVQKVLETAAYDLLDLIVVYPVEDEHHYTDHDGRVLPDAHLLRRGSTARDLAYKVHSDLGDNFIRAMDCKQQRTIGADHMLENGDVIKIHSNA